MQVTAQHKKWIAVGCAAIIALMLATNPDQAAHLRTIRETSALTSSQPYSAASDFTGAMSYNNYFLFSTVTLADAIVSWGPSEKFIRRIASQTLSASKNKSAFLRGDGKLSYNRAEHLLWLISLRTEKMWELTKFPNSKFQLFFLTAAFSTTAASGRSQDA